MSNLPFTLPTCDRPATTRLPVYTPAPDGSGSSLDAVAYVCTEHASQAVTAIRAAGLNIYPGPLAPDLARTCGYVYVFPTGAYGAHPPALEHPAWCDRQNCERRGEHRSPARHVDTNQPEATIVDVALIQALHPAAEPMLSLTGVDGTAAPEPIAVHLVLSIGQGRTLRYRLAQLIDATKGGRR